MDPDMPFKAIEELESFMTSLIEEKSQFIRETAHQQLDFLFDNLTNMFCDQMTEQLTNHEFFGRFFSEQPQQQQPQQPLPLTQHIASGYPNMAQNQQHYSSRSSAHHKKPHQSVPHYPSSFLVDQSQTSWSNVVAAVDAAAAAASSSASMAANHQQQPSVYGQSMYESKQPRGQQMMANSARGPYLQQQQKQRQDTHKLYYHHQRRPQQHLSHPMQKTDWFSPNAKNLVGAFDQEMKPSHNGIKNHGALSNSSFDSNGFPNSARSNFGFASRNNVAPKAPWTSTEGPNSSSIMDHGSNTNDGSDDSIHSPSSDNSCEIISPKNLKSRPSSSSPTNKSSNQSNSSPNTGNNHTDNNNAGIANLNNANSEAANGANNVSMACSNTDNVPANEANSNSITKANNTNGSSIDDSSSINKGNKSPLQLAKGSSSNDPAEVNSGVVSLSHIYSDSLMVPNQHVNSSNGNGSAFAEHVVKKRRHSEDINTAGSASSSGRNNEDTSPNAGKKEKYYNGALIKCDLPECDAYFDNPSALNLHLQKKHNILPHFCILCSMSYTSTQGLKDHIDRDHSDVIKFVCHTCFSAYPSYRSLSTHFKRQHFKRQYKCPLSGCTFTSDQCCAIVAHRETEHEQN